MASFIDESSRTNPWNNQEPKHPYDDILDLFQQSRHHETLPKNEVIAQCNETNLFRGMIVIEEANEARQRLKQIRTKCLKLELENRTSDILRSEELKSNLNEVEKILNGFETCVTDAQKLQSTLMQTFKGDFMKLERKYHRSFRELFTNSVKILHRLQNELDTLQWHESNTVDNIELKNVLKTLSESVSEIEHGLSVIEKSQIVMNEKF